MRLGWAKRPTRAQTPRHGPTARERWPTSADAGKDLFPGVPRGTAGRNGSHAKAKGIEHGTDHTNPFDNPVLCR